MHPPAPERVSKVRGENPHSQPILSPRRSSISQRDHSYLDTGNSVTFNSASSDGSRTQITGELGLVVDGPEGGVADAEVVIPHRSVTMGGLKIGSDPDSHRLV